MPNVSLNNLWEAMRRGMVKVERRRRTAKQIINQLEKEIRQGQLF